MIGFGPFRNLHSVMAVTLHVALTSYLIRSLTTPDSVAGSFAVWVPVSILLAIFISWPLGRMIAQAFDPPDTLVDGRCPRCHRGELRPLLRAGGGLFQPPTGYRCSGCWTTFRPVGESIVEEPGPVAVAESAVDPEGIQFLPEPRADPADLGEIRYLEPDDPTANIPSGSVSERDRNVTRTERVGKGWVEDGDQGRIHGTSGAGGTLPVADSPILP